MNKEHLLFDKLLIKTAFCCMSSDRHIDKRELEIIKLMCEKLPLLQNIDFNVEIPKLISELSVKGKNFIVEYFDLIDKANLTEEQKLILADFAIQVIKGDDKIEYSEIKFFKNIRRRLRLNEETQKSLLQKFPDIESFFEDDISTENSITHITNQYLDLFELPNFNYEIKKDNN